MKTVTAIKNYLVTAIMAIIMSTGDTLWATPNHSIYTTSGYKEAAVLTVGDTLWSYSGAYERIISKTLFDTTLQVYDLAVSENHNYYVGEEGVLVHNNGECFLKNLGANYNTLTTKIDALDEANKSQFLLDFFDALDDVLKMLDGNPGMVRAWEKVKHSLGAGITAKVTDVPFLQKFDDIVQNNNLGLDANGLQGILNAAANKGHLWDEPGKILDAVKRASDGNISGMAVSHKKFPAAANGYSGDYLVPAKQYQKAASGDANLSFEVGGRSFDNVATDGKLVDRKFGHCNSIFDSIENEFGEVELIVSNESRIISLLNQAKGQLNAAGGHPIRWEISTSTGADGIGQVFNGLGGYANLPQFQGINFNAIGCSCAIINES